MIVKLFGSKNWVRSALPLPRPSFGHSGQLSCSFEAAYAVSNAVLLKQVNRSGFPGDHRS